MNGKASQHLRNMNTMPIALFRNRACAEAVHQRLAASGISAAIQEESPFQRLWFVLRPNAGVSIEVPANQLDVARQRLLEWKSTGAGVPGAVACPECGSLQVVYPQFTKRSLLTNVIMGLGAAVGVIEKEFYCEACHYTWARNDEAAVSIQPGNEPPQAAPGEGRKVA